MEIVQRDIHTWAQFNIYINDANVLSKIESGEAQELSIGFLSDVDRAEGQDYDFIIKNIDINHVGIVQEGRAGKEGRLFNGNLFGNGHVFGIHGRKKFVNNEAVKMAKILVNGVTFDVDADLSTAFSEETKSQKQKYSDVVKVRDSLQAKVDAQDEAVKKLENAKPDIQQIVACELEFMNKLNSISSKAEYKPGDNQIDIMRETLKNAKVNVEDKSDEYIEARFDLLVETQQKDSPLNKITNSGPTNQAGHFKSVIDQFNSTGKYVQEKS